VATDAAMMTPAQAQQLRFFVGQCLLALARVAALAIFGGVHWLSSQVMHQVIPADWTRIRVGAEAVFAVAFLAIYLDQLWDMVAVFIPRLRGLHEAVVGRDTTQAARKGPS
jgi:hypothetical protein